MPEEEELHRSFSACARCSMPRVAGSTAHTRITCNPPRRRHRQIRSREEERRPHICWIWPGIESRHHCYHGMVAGCR